MSLVPTYVRADNEEFYRDPIIRGDDFFLCFDDDDPPELVIMQNGRNAAQLRKRLWEIIVFLKIDATPTTTLTVSSGRIFSSDQSDMNFQEAYSVFLDINKPIPVSIITEHEGIYNGHGEGAFETFDKTFNLTKWMDKKFKGKNKGIR